MSGHKIIDGLRDAINGDMTSVTIEGQKWVRADAIHADHQEIMRINNSLRETLKFVREQVDRNSYGRTLTLAKIDEAIR